MTCEDPAKKLMEQLAQKQALVPLTQDETASAALRSDIRNLNTKAGYITAATRRQLEDFAYALNVAEGKLGAADKQVPKTGSDAALAELKKVTTIDKMCALSI